MKVNKVCPVILRQTDCVEILAFEHPLAGFQLVKGSIEQGETARNAAIRELYEEAGIVDAQVIKDLGIWESQYLGQIWSFHVCQSKQSLPDTWKHLCQDDGGHVFRFFWYPLHQQATTGWHSVFSGALSFVNKALA